MQLPGHSVATEMPVKTWRSAESMTDSEEFLNYIFSFFVLIEEHIAKGAVSLEEI